VDGYSGFSLKPSRLALDRQQVVVRQHLECYVGADPGLWVN
jgi:hypothetical protein